MNAAPLPDYQVTGTSEVTVFLAHGLIGAKDYWRFHTERLVGQGYRVVAWDAPGYEISPRPEPYDFPTLAAAAAALVRHTGSRINILHGHSMGGQLTPRLYSLVPELVSGVVIASTIGYFGNRTKAEQEEFVNARARAVNQPMDPAKMIAGMVGTLMAPDAAGEEVDLVREVGGRTPPETFRAALKAIQAYPDDEAVAAIRGIRVPTLLIAGELDQTGKPDGMRRVADMIAGSEFAVIEGSGHYGWAEKPALFNAILHPFLARVAGNAAM